MEDIFKKIKIIHENENFLVVNKPSGLVTHGDGRSKDKNLADWIVETRPDMKNVGEPWETPKGEKIFRPGIVHRLDKETSGILIIAKNEKTFQLLKTAFQGREVQKTYRVFVYGEMKNETGVIRKPIGRSKSDFRKWSAEYGARGDLREAETEYKVLKAKKEVTYLEAYPKTGRTHQIRVHLKSVGHPVVGDSLYAEGKEKILGFSRLALHAFALEFTLDGKKFRFEADMPEDFLTAVKGLD